MNRRSAIKSIVIVSAAGAMLPSCLQENNKTTLALKKLKITAHQEKLLALITQTIIPTTDTPGASEERSHEFVLKMVDDCASPEDQQKFMSGLGEFESLVQERFRQPFAALDKTQQKEFLVSIEKKKDVPENVAGFYRTVRGLTLQSYTGSEYYMTNVSKYSMIPKRYKGCVAVANI
jgi:Gluconate 2-dehydrogenase subunit 3